MLTIKGSNKRQNKPTMDIYHNYVNNIYIIKYDIQDDMEETLTKLFSI